MVELRRGLVELGGPGLAAVHSDGRATIVAVDHALGLRRIDPQPVVVAVGGGQQLEALAAIDGTEGAGVQGVDRVQGLGIRHQVAEVPGPLAEALIGIDTGPGGAAVLGAVEAALGGLNGGPDPIGIHRRDGEANAPVDARRQAAAAEQLPGAAAVHTLVESGAGAARREAPGRALHLPQGRVEYIAVGGVELHVDGAGVHVLEEHLLPVGAAVHGAEDTPLGIGAVGVAQGRHEHPVGVLGIHHHPTDVPRVPQTHGRPSLAAVVGLVDAGAVGDVAPDAGLPRAHIDRVGLRGRHGEGSDGGDVLVIEQGDPGVATIAGLPDPTSHPAEVEGVRIAGDARDRQHAPAPERPHLTPLHGRQGRGGEFWHSGSENLAQDQEGQAHEWFHPHENLLLH